MLLLLLLLLLFMTLVRNDVAAATGAVRLDRCRDEIGRGGAGGRCVRVGDFLLALAGQAAARRERRERVLDHIEYGRLALRLGHGRRRRRRLAHHHHRAGCIRRRRVHYRQRYHFAHEVVVAVVAGGGVGGMVERCRLDGRRGRRVGRRRGGRGRRQRIHMLIGDRVGC